MQTVIVYYLLVLDVRVNVATHSFTNFYSCIFYEPTHAIWRVVKQFDILGNGRATFIENQYLFISIILSANIPLTVTIVLYKFK